MSHSLEQFLEQARSGGVVESTGSFSLDAERARRLLSALRLSGTVEFLLKFAQAALCAEADRLEYHLHRDRVEVAFFGENLLLIDTQSLLDALTDQKLLLGESALSHLAVGLNAAAAQESREIEWTAWSVWRQERLVLNAEETRLEVLEERPWPDRISGYRLVVWRKALVVDPVSSKSEGTGFWSRLKSYVGGVKQAAGRLAEEHLALWERLTHFPLPVELDGLRLDRGSNLGSSEALLFLSGGHNRLKNPQAFEFVRAYRPHHGQWLPYPNDGGRAGSLIAVRQKFSRRLVLYHYGVKLQELNTPSWQTGWTLHASTQGLKLDLGQQGVVEDERFEKWLKEVERIVHHRTRGDSSLAAATEPLLPYVHPSDLGELDSDAVSLELTRHKTVKRLAHQVVRGLALELDDSGLGGELKILHPAWPPHPPPEPSAREWSAWVRGAVACVKRAGAVRITSDMLLGPYQNERADGIHAEFHDTHQLKSLSYYHKGRPKLWTLELDRIENRGVARFLGRRWEQHFKIREVVSDPDPPQTPIEIDLSPQQIWADWVRHWIKNIYRISLL